jgi:two-component system, OmpR family, sensor histidine kinase CiaH
MFHKTSVKLAALYLAIMMGISIFFSANIYQLSVQELDRGLRRPSPAIERITPRELGPTIRDLLEQDREQRYQEARSRVLNRLVLINLLILIGGGYISYLLALRTLRPIEEAHEALERFTADASHELRTPIAAMQAEIEVALMNPKLTLKDAKQRLQSNLEELAKLTALSEGLLRLAQLNNQELELKQVSVESMVSTAVQRVLPLAELKNILINVPSIQDLQVIGDEQSLTEALVILLDNAVKYSSEKSEITLEAKATNKDVVISVQDQGIGIKATELPHIFDRFYRADSARSKQDSNGYGIGLAIAKNIIDLHKGAIGVKSKPGKGSTFTISLPAKS